MYFTAGLLGAMLWSDNKSTPPKTIDQIQKEWSHFVRQEAFKAKINDLKE